MRSCNLVIRQLKFGTNFYSSGWRVLQTMFVHSRIQAAYFLTTIVRTYRIQVIYLQNVLPILIEIELLAKWGNLKTRFPISGYRTVWTRSLSSQAAAVPIFGTLLHRYIHILYIHTCTASQTYSYTYTNVRAYCMQMN